MTCLIDLTNMQKKDNACFAASQGCLAYLMGENLDGKWSLSNDAGLSDQSMEQTYPKPAPHPIGVPVPEPRPPQPRQPPSLPESRPPRKQRAVMGSTPRPPPKAYGRDHGWNPNGSQDNGRAGRKRKLGPQQIATHVVTKIVPPAPPLSSNIDVSEYQDPDIDFDQMEPAQIMTAYNLKDCHVDLSNQPQDILMAAVAEIGLDKSPAPVTEQTTELTAVDTASSESPAVVTEAVQAAPSAIPLDTPVVTVVVPPVTTNTLNPPAKRPGPLSQTMVADQTKQPPQVLVAANPEVMDEPQAGPSGLQAPVSKPRILRNKDMDMTLLAMKAQAKEPIPPILTTKDYFITRRVHDRFIMMLLELNKFGASGDRLYERVRHLIKIKIRAMDTILTVAAGKLGVFNFYE